MREIIEMTKSHKTVMYYPKTDARFARRNKKLLLKGHMVTCMDGSSAGKGAIPCPEESASKLPSGVKKKPNKKRRKQDEHVRRKVELCCNTCGKIYVRLGSFRKHVAAKNCRPKTAKRKKRAPASNHAAKSRKQAGTDS